MPKTNTDNQSADSQPPSIDLALVSQAVVNLHIARRTLLIYPTTHEQVKLSIIRAYRKLSEILAHDKQLSLMVMKDGLGVGEHQLKTGSEVFKDLAGVLKHYRVAMVTFDDAIKINELARFLQLITTDREKVDARGGIEAVARRCRIPHIHIKAVDYSKLQLTEEQEIKRSAGDGREGGSLWQKFVSHMAAAGAEAQAFEADVPATDPNLLAKLLNTRKLDTRHAVDQYQVIIRDVADSKTDQQLLTDGLIKFKKMISSLNTELQRQFLSATFENFAQTASMSDTARLIDGLGGELILRMLMQANAEGRKISPSLLAFVQKMGPADMLLKHDSASPSAQEPSGELSGDKLASLLSPEQHETYVDEKYSELLSNLTAQPSRQDSASNFREAVDAALTDAQINIHTGRAITRLMINSRDTAGYRDWARQLTYLLDDLLESRSFAYLAELMVLMRKGQRSRNEERAGIAKLVLDKFSDPQFVADAVEKARRPDGEIATDALAFLIELGESVAVELLEELDPSETFSGNRFYEKLLNDLGTVTAKEALARIKDPRPDYVQRMVRIIRRVGDADTAAHLKPLLEHADIDVRMEALATLLKFGNNWGLIRLREQLAGPWSDEVCRAIQLAGRFKVRELVPELIEYLQRRGDPARREAAVGALGRIGDPRAIAVLTRVAHRRWSLARKQTRRLKHVLFENLHGYAYTDIKALLHWGIKQKDPVIRSACEKWLKIAHRHGRPAKPERRR